MIWSTSKDQMIITAYGERESSKHDRQFAIAAAHNETGDGKDMIYGVVPEGERAANARLIAAAPDLYIACKMLEDDPGLTAGANDVIKFALAKARGEAHVQ
jgi:hypothetical protein